MKSYFQQYIMEELDSFGEFSLQELVPKYLEKNKNKKLFFPLSEYSENYDIDDINFSLLLKEVTELMKLKKLCLYRYNYKNNKNWENSFDLLEEDESLKILNNKRSFFCKKNNPIIYISFCEFK